MKQLAYLLYVIRHKWYVFLACKNDGLIIRGIIHDWSKLLPGEFFPYADYFGGNIKKGRDKTGYYKPTDTGHQGFEMAWLRHSKRNKHHWQYWAIPTEPGDVKTYPMPEKYIDEMLCDWIGAGRAQKAKGSTAGWWKLNKDKMQLHADTVLYIENRLKEPKFQVENLKKK